MQWKWAVVGPGQSHVRAALWRTLQNQQRFGEALTSRDEESGAVGIGTAYGVGGASLSRRSASSYAGPAEGPIS